MTRNSVLLGLLLVGLGHGPRLPITAPECVVYDSLDKEFSASTAVFEARVVAVEWIPGRECCHVLSGWATLETGRWWKGEPVREVKVGAVGQIFTLGQQYVVFATGDPPVADGCNSTKPLVGSVKTLEWLKGKPRRRAG